MVTSVVFIGSGRVATHMLLAFANAGYCVRQVYSRNIVSARALAAPLGISYTDDLSAVSTDADMYLVSVADDALPQVVELLVRGRERALFLHTAGSVSMDVWRDAGALRYGILYPLQTFSKEKSVDMHSVPLFVEASDEAVLDDVWSIAASLSSFVYRADSEKRMKLHVAAVFACNFTNAMYSVADRLLGSVNIPFSVLLPLIDETACKVHSLSPCIAQTGPAARGDEKVMNSHVEVLSSDTELRDMYLQISNYIKRNI